ncbi:MAG TPA: hypothetical protein VGE66_03970, partial [Chitinophagaceae bacterium]
MNRLLLFCIPAILWSCSAEEKDRNIEIVIQSEQAYTFDLHKGIMKVYYLSKPPTQISLPSPPKSAQRLLTSIMPLDWTG